MYIVILVIVLAGFIPIIERLKSSVSPFSRLWLNSCIWVAFILFLLEYSDPSWYWFGFAGMIVYGLFTEIRRYKKACTDNTTELV